MNTANMARAKEILLEASHLALQAGLSDDEAKLRAAAADISELVAGLLPAERAARRAAPTDGRAASMTPPQWKAKYNYINACDIEAMSLEIPGHKFTAYVAQTIDKEWDGIIMENGKEVVLVHTMGRGKSFTGRVTKYAMRGVASRVGHYSRLHANKRLRLGILTPEQELARTVAVQKEVL